MPLTEKQQRFADAYRGDAKAAAVAAGYSGTDGSLKVTGSRLLRHPGVLEVLKSRGVRPRIIVQRRRKGSRLPASAPSTSPSAPAEAPPDDIDEEAVLRHIVQDPGSKPVEVMRALRELRELREMAEAEGRGEDLGDAPPGQTVAWVSNGRVPSPAPVVLDAFLRLDPAAQRWLLAVVERADLDPGDPLPPWGDLDAGAAASVAELDDVIAGLASATLRRYVLAVILRDAYAPPVVRARAAELHGLETTE